MLKGCGGGETTNNCQILPSFAGQTPRQEGFLEASPHEEGPVLMRFRGTVSGAVEAVWDARRQLFRHIGSGRSWARGGRPRSTASLKNACASLRPVSKLSCPPAGTSKTATHSLGIQVANVGNIYVLCGPM